MEQNHTVDMEASSSPSALQSPPEGDSLSVLLARIAIFIFLFGLICLLLDVDRNSMGTILIGVALVFIILSLKKIIRGNWRRKKTRRNSTVRICVSANQWRRIFGGEPSMENNQPQTTSFTCLEGLMQMPDGMYPPATPVPPLLAPPSYEQAVAETEQPQTGTETNGSVENDSEQREVQGSNGDTETKLLSVSTGTNADEV